jgi:hypothetical protein
MSSDSGTKFHPQFIKDDQGKNSYVVLPADEYEELLEDLADLAVIAERRDEPTISLEELRERLEKDGLL